MCFLTFVTFKNKFYNCIYLRERVSESERVGAGERAKGEGEAGSLPTKGVQCSAQSWDSGIMS